MNTNDELKADLINPTPLLISTHLGIRHKTISNFLHTDPKTGHYTLEYNYKWLKSKKGKVSVEVKHPGVAFTKTHCCIKNHYFDLNKMNLPYWFIRHRIPLFWVRNCPSSHVESLIKLGFDVNTTMRHIYQLKIRSIFSCALEENRPDVAIMALRYGADPYDKKQYTNWKNEVKSFEEFLGFVTDEDAVATIKMKVQLLN